MAGNSFPFEVNDADQEIRRKLFPSSSLHTEGCIVGPKKYFLHPAYKKYGNDIYNFEAREDDVYLVGFSRSGTTVHCEMVWLIANDLDYQTAREQILLHRFIHIDESIIPLKLLTPGDKIPLRKLQKMTKRRFIQAHIPLSLMPPSIFKKRSKVIYVARNPKDVIVSCYYGYKLLCDNDEIVDSFEQYFKMFKNNWGWFLPFFDHVKEGWSRRNDENFLFLFYEDFLKDTRKTIVKVTDFLDRKMTDQQIDELINHLDFKNFKNNGAVNLEHITSKAKTDIPFIRKGTSGGWRDYFVGNLAEEVDAWIEKNLRGSDLIFPD